MIASAVMNGLRQRTFSGLGWNGAAQISVQMLQFVASVVLARLLGPREFGLMGMVLTFTGFASVLSDMGLGAAVIQRRDLSERHLNSVFWINVGMGVLLTALFAVAAPLIARFYREPLLRLLAAVASVNFILMALSVAQNSLIDKTLNFRARFWIETISILVSGIVAVFMALAGAGVWSLVGQSLAFATARLAVTWRLSTWRPTWSFDPGALKELFPFSRNLLGHGVFSYWGRNIDRLLVGRLVGSVGLGVYSFAFRLMSLPVNTITDVTNAVMFPAFSAIQEDREALSRVYLRSTRMIALVTFPMMIGLATLAEPAVLLVYGERWRAGIGIIQVLAFSGMVQSVYNTATWLFLSQGRTDILFRLAVYASLVRVGGAAVGISWGISGVAWAYVVGTYGFLWYPIWDYAGSLVNLRFGRLLQNLAGPLLCAVGMGAVVWICDRWLRGAFGPLLRVAAGVPLGILVYGLLIRQSRLEAWHELREALLEVGSPRFPFLGRMLGEKSCAEP